MRPHIILICLLGGVLWNQGRGADAAASYGPLRIEGELRQWHKVTLTLDGPRAAERDNDPNPFTDYRLSVVFRHESGSPTYSVPGYFAADGDAANTSAESGTKWRTHLAPDRPGKWFYKVEFVRGRGVALDPAAAGEKLEGLSGKEGFFEVARTNKTGRDLRARGRLEYAGKHHLRFAGSGEYFFKAGADSPENLLAYADFDGTHANRTKPAREGEAIPTDLKTWQPHIRDWKDGDPTWKGGRGRGLIGALNYLAGTGCNAFSFLTYNAGGDGDDVWPFVDRNDKMHYDCSKLDQWQIVFDHAQRLGMYLHFKLQETENDDNRLGNNAGAGSVPTALDGGDLGTERKLYLRELIARFGHELALNWNLGEENSQSPPQQQVMARYIRDIDPYTHHIVVHTFPNQQDQVYTALLGDKSVLTGASLQNGWNEVHARTIRWITESARAGRPWVVANDEQGPASFGVPPDPGYAGFKGRAGEKGGKGGYDLHDIRKAVLWGNLMAGGAGVEYYFGYQLPENDLGCEDFRSRAATWNYCRIAIRFLREHKVPFWEMVNADTLVGNAGHDNSRYCLSWAGGLYLVYLPAGGTAELDLTASPGEFSVRWFNPRSGGALERGSVDPVKGGGRVSLGAPPRQSQDDWLAVIRKR